MRKCVAICATLAALVWAGVAAAAIPQGSLTGSASLAAPFSSTFAATNIIDGGTSYVGLENDKSGNCNGDSGSVTQGTLTANIVCAHYVASSGCCNAGSHKMRFAYPVGALYSVVRITDNGGSGDTFAYGVAFSLAEAQLWVNMGAFGSGHTPALFNTWAFVGVLSGGWTVAASPPA